MIGGGDWAADRIVPDMIRSLNAGKPIGVRNPKAVRPWQHVLEPLSGYLQLAENMTHEEDTLWQSAFNFGPEATDFRSVKELVEESLNTGLDLGRINPIRTNHTKQICSV